MQKSVALITHPLSAAHQTPAGHAEQIPRIHAVENAISAPQFAPLIRHTARRATDAMILRGHTSRYLQQLKNAVPAEGIAALDPDTFLSPDSLEAAYHGVGGLNHAIDLVLSGAAHRAFCAHRPPGHHAEKDRAMGFCLFGTVALGALHALEQHGLRKIGIIDFDVHHGNGTQDILWEDDRIFFASSHQMPLYPGSGAAEETGAHGQIMNIPLPPESDGALMRSAYQKAILPALENFGPDLILISAGFDAHIADPLAQLRWDEEDFGWLTREICAIADRICAGRVVSNLEGGYDLPALASSAATHLAALMEGDA